MELMKNLKKSLFSILLIATQLHYASEQPNQETTRTARTNDIRRSSIMDGFINLDFATYTLEPSVPSNYAVEAAAIESRRATERRLRSLPELDRDSLFSAVMQMSMDANVSNHNNARTATPVTLSRSTSPHTGIFNQGSVTVIDSHPSRYPIFYSLSYDSTSHSNNQVELIHAEVFASESDSSQGRSRSQSDSSQESQTGPSQLIGQRSDTIDLLSGAAATLSITSDRNNETRRPSMDTSSSDESDTTQSRNKRRRR